MGDTFYEILLNLFAALNDYVYTLLGMIPNPDPFPGIISGMDIEITDGYRVAWYWLDAVFDMEILLSVIGAWFTMFAIGWIIMMLWKWAKMR